MALDGPVNHESDALTTTPASQHYDVCGLCGQIDDADKYAYIGTTSGDVIIINIPMQKLRGTLPPVKKRFNMGVTAIGQFKSGEFVVGAGDGLVCLCDPLFNRTEYVPCIRRTVYKVSK